MHLAGLDLYRTRIDFLVETVRSQHRGLPPTHLWTEVYGDRVGNRGFGRLRRVNTTSMAGIGDVLEWARHQVASRVPKADLDQRDPDYIREQLPGLWLLASLYFRADVRCLERIPADGPVLLVGNHSGGNVPPDTFVFSLAFCSYFGVERPFYQLAHNLVVSAPPLGSLRKFGTVAANHENAKLALESGAALLVYPGGDYEVFRPSWERHKVDFGGRKGYVQLAREAGVPIVPIASVGGQESVLFLSRGQWLAKLLRTDKMFRLKSVPIAIAPPWGLVIGDLAGHIPLPSKIVIEALDPIQVDGDDQAVHDKVLASLQDGVDRLAAERRFPVIG
jgi:1-acyl-sn-glycerol-3-phosphate acyltransferase